MINKIVDRLYGVDKDCFFVGNMYWFLKLIILLKVKLVCIVIFFFIDGDLLKGLVFFINILIFNSFCMCLLLI